MWIWIMLRMFLVPVTSLHLCLIWSSISTTMTQFIISVQILAKQQEQDVCTWEYWWIPLFSSYLFWCTCGSSSYIFLPLLNIPGDYVRTHNLRVGDFIMIYKDDDKNRFVLNLSSWLFKHFSHFGTQSVVAYCMLLCVMQRSSEQRRREMI